MIKRKKLIVSVIITTLMLGIIPYASHINPISKAANHGLSNPRVKQDGTVTWDCVYFGNYWQNDTNSDGVADQNDDKEPIKWRVLSINGNDAFLLSDKALDEKPYNEKKGWVQWENCTLRTWLNNSFYNIAFDNKEKEIITETKAIINIGDGASDKVSILSNIDACNAFYGFNPDGVKSYGFKFTFDCIKSETRLAKISAYAKANGAFSHKENGCWWLRPYNDEFEEIYWVNADGSFEDHSNEYINGAGNVVRPCIHINLSSNAWTKADTVTATGGSFITPTPTTTTTPTSTPTPTPTPKPVPKITSTPIPWATITPTEPSIQPKDPPKITNEQKTVTAPAKVKSLSAKNKKKKSVTLSWKKVKDATGYQVQYTVNTAFAKKKLKSTKKNKLVIKKLKKKKTYSFRVRAYKISNDVKVYGSWSKAKRVKIRK